MKACRSTLRRRSLRSASTVSASARSRCRASARAKVAAHHRPTIHRTIRLHHRRCRLRPPRPVRNPRVRRSRRLRKQFAPARRSASRATVLTNRGTCACRSRLVSAMSSSRSSIACRRSTRPRVCRSCVRIRRGSTFPRRVWARICAASRSSVRSTPPGRDNQRAGAASSRVRLRGTRCRAHALRTKRVLAGSSRR